MAWIAFHQATSTTTDYSSSTTQSTTTDCSRPVRIILFLSLCNSGISIKRVVKIHIRNFKERSRISRNQNWRCGGKNDSTGGKLRQPKPWGNWKCYWTSDQCKFSLWKPGLDVKKIGPRFGYNLLTSRYSSGCWVDFLNIYNSLIHCCWTQK